MSRIDCRFEWKPEDLWIGAFWRRTEAKTDEGQKRIATTIWICLIPCVPLRVTIWRPISITF
jgi:hypothetical protein